MNSPITIVIPARNRSEVLPRTLRSIERQSVAPAKVVLVDNGSTDSTLRLMEDWATLPHGFEVTVTVEERAGACAARNRGLREVETDFVMFFDSDDEMLPAHIADFTAAIEARPDVDIFGRDIISESSEGTRRRLYFTDRNPMFNHLFRGCLSTQRVVVRTSLVRSVGGWEEDLAVWNDFELGSRLLLGNAKIKRLAGSPTVIAYRLDESITGTSFSAKAGQWERSLDRMEAGFKAAGRTDLVKWLDCRRMILAAHYRHENSPALSDDLLRSTLAGNVNAARLRLVYRHNLCFRRLTWLFSRLLFCV